MCCSKVMCRFLRHCGFKTKGRSKEKSRARGRSITMKETTLRDIAPSSLQVTLCKEVVAAAMSLKSHPEVIKHIERYVSSRDAS